jgi:UDP-3-O-[3-hydroxymyristoyl] N-acetylglucosamine deacetylase
VTVDGPARTLARAVAVKAPGGQRVVLRPNTRGDGIWFHDRRTGKQLAANARDARRHGRATMLEGAECRFRRVEHLLSALAGSGVGHAILDMNGETVPLLDGSAMPWVNAIGVAGTRRLAGPHRTLSVTDTVEVRSGDRWVRAVPSTEFRVRYTLDYPGLKLRSKTVTISPGAYRREIAPARTFCGEHEAAVVRTVDPEGLSPVVLFDDQGRPDRPLRFEDESVRHKLLDLVGDLALVGRPIRSFVEARGSGHALHIELARRLADSSHVSAEPGSGAVAAPSAHHG